MPPAGAVSVQTWVRHRFAETDLPEVELLDSVLHVLQRTAMQDPRGLETTVGRDSSRLNVRSVAAVDRWPSHLAAHAEWLCGPRWAPEILEEAAAMAPAEQGWQSVGHRLSRTAWRARTGAARGRRGPISADTVASALERWLVPGNAVVVITGPVEQSVALEEAEARYSACRGTRPERTPTPASGPVRPRSRIRVPGPHRHLLASWSIDLDGESTAAALEALALALGDPDRSPLRRRLVPATAEGVAVRYRRRGNVGDLEVLMTLAPSVTASVAVNRAKRAIRTMTGNQVRAVAGVRNRTLRRLSTLQGPGDFAADALLHGRSLRAMSVRIQALVDIDPASVHDLASLAFERRPLLVLALPRGKK